MHFWFVMYVYFYSVVVVKCFICQLWGKPYHILYVTMHVAYLAAVRLKIGYGL